MNTCYPTPGWHTFGELTLSVSVNTDEAILAWLMQILAPLNLSPDFLARLLRSAQESAGRTCQPNVTGSLPYIHISILVPCEHIRLGKPWGFFHMERMESSANGGSERHHAIDFYLYVEGD